MSKCLYCARAEAIGKNRSSAYCSLEHATLLALAQGRPLTAVEVTAIEAAIAKATAPKLYAWDQLEIHPAPRSSRDRWRSLGAWRAGRSYRGQQVTCTLRAEGQPAREVASTEVDWNAMPPGYHSAIAPSSGTNLAAADRGSVSLSVSRRDLERLDSLATSRRESRQDTLRAALAALEVSSGAV